MEPLPQDPASNKDTVDAIEEGKIVRVPESYAKLEGLPILRKALLERKKPLPEPEKVSFDDLRKPLRPNQVTTELIDNFHWHIQKMRRHLGLTRKQLAKSINEPEHILKLIENGVIPKKDFIIINKIQEILGTNLRKDEQDFTQSPRSLLNEPLPIDTETNSLSNGEDITGDDIELIEEEQEEE